MAKKKPAKIIWDKAAKKELKKFTDFISHCRDFAETIAIQKEHPAVTEEDVADAIQEYAKLWAGMVSKKKPPAPVAAPKTKPKKVPAKPVVPQIDEATQKQIDELKKFIKEEEEAGDSGFGDPKARIAHWKREIEELQKPQKKM
jgi:hypothetical protein